MYVRLLTLALLTAGARAQAPFCDRIRALTVDPTVAAAHWGVAVSGLDGTLLCGVNEGQLFRPASNAKIFTTAAALALLGPGATVQTRVTGQLEPVSGVVSGDLTLVGGADANLDSNDLPYLPPAQRPKTPRVQSFHDLDDLAAQLVAKGVKSVTGDIVGDDTLFPYEPYPPSWNGDDFVWYYGAPVSALTIADNQLKLTIAPGQTTLEQFGVAYYTVQSYVTTGPAKSHSAVQVERLAGSRIIRVYGQMAADAAPDVEEIAIDDPAAFAAMVFRNVLLAHGIAVTGSSRAQHLPVMDGEGFTAGLMAGDREASFLAGGIQHGSCLSRPQRPTLATHVSAPLADDVIYTDKVSQNLHAELLLHRLGRVMLCGSGSNVAGARMIRAYMLRAGVQPNDFLFYDGSGLSDHDLVAPRATVKFLGFAATQPWFPAFKAALPDAGVDGTLASRFKAPVAFKLSAKTGTLGESRALSGYLTTAAGEELIFSIMVDTHLPTSTADRTIMDKIVETIANHD